MKKSGFTLIEILVIVFIVGLMSAILVVNWHKNEKTYLVQRTAQEIAQNIRKVQDLALNGKKYSSDVTSSSLFGVYFDKQSANSYWLFDDKNGNGTFQPADELIENPFIDSSIEIYSISTNNKLTITFSVPDGFVYINNSRTNPSSATISIRKIGVTCPSTSCRDIIITNTGQISIQ